MSGKADTATENTRVLQLVRFARETMAAGRVTEAMRIWQQVLSLAPRHPQALFHLGAYALYQKEPARARDLLARAAEADPNAAAIALNLAHAYRELGDAQNEMDAITRALTIDPHYFPAIMAKGGLTERTGSIRAAAKIYKRAMASAPPDDEIPPDLLAATQRARDIIREDAAALEYFIDQRLSGPASRHTGKNLQRFEECKAIALGTRKAYTQKPAMLLVPWLPAIPFYEDGDFPWLKDVENLTEVIREELVGAMKADTGGFRPYVQRAEDTPLDEWRALNKSPRWSAYYFWKDGRHFEESCRQCPVTASVRNLVPAMDAHKFGPTMMFSVLSPGTHLPAHSSATNARLIVHLPLIVPPGTRFRVGNETREWREGKAWVFDDTIDHEAWNDSAEVRSILLFDIWNPLLTPAERDLIPVLLNGINEYYSAE